MISTDLNIGIVEQLVEEIPIRDLVVCDGEIYNHVDLTIYVKPRYESEPLKPGQRDHECKIVSITFEDDGWWTIHSKIDGNYAGYSISMIEPSSLALLEAEIILNYGIYKAEKSNNNFMKILTAFWFLFKATWPLRKVLIVEIKNRVTERWRNR